LGVESDRMCRNRSAVHAAPPDIAHIYLATIATIHDAGAWHPAHQVAARRGTLHVISAWNPGDERLSREENDRGNRALVDAGVRSAAQQGWTLGVDQPNADSMVLMRYFGRDARVMSVMIEVNRELYMTVDGDTARKSLKLRTATPRAPSR